jgi:hypothetical protein
MATHKKARHERPDVVAAWNRRAPRFAPEERRCLLYLIDMVYDDHSEVDAIRKMLEGEKP